MRKTQNTYKTCEWCNGKGERRESVSYYDVEWVNCTVCLGLGSRMVTTRYYEDPQPFPLARW